MMLATCLGGFTKKSFRIGYDNSNHWLQKKTVSRTARVGLASYSLELSRTDLELSRTDLKLSRTDLNLSRTAPPPSTARGTATGGFTLKATSKITKGRMALPNPMNFRSKVPRGVVIFNPKIYIADFGPLYRALKRDFRKNCNVSFRKWGWGKGRLEFVQTFLRLGNAIRPLQKKWRLWKYFVWRPTVQYQNETKAYESIWAAVRFSHLESLVFSLLKRGPVQNTLKDDVFTSGQWYSSTQLTFQGLGRITQIAWTRKTPHFFWQSTRCWCYESISLVEFLFFCHQWLFLNIYIVLVIVIYEMKFITLVWRRSLY